MLSHPSKAPFIFFPDTGQHNRLGLGVQPKLYFPFLIKLVIPCKCWSTCLSFAVIPWGKHPFSMVPEKSGGWSALWLCFLHLLPDVRKCIILKWSWSCRSSELKMQKEFSCSYQTKVVFNWPGANITPMCCSHWPQWPREKQIFCALPRAGGHLRYSCHHTQFTSPASFFRHIGRVLCMENYSLTKASQQEQDSWDGSTVVVIHGPDLP